MWRKPRTAGESADVLDVEHPGGYFSSFYLETHPPVLLDYGNEYHTVLYSVPCLSDQAIFFVFWWELKPSLHLWRPTGLPEQLWSAKTESVVADGKSGLPDTDEVHFLNSHRRTNLNKISMNIFMDRLDKNFNMFAYNTNLLNLVVYISRSHWLKGIG